MKSIQHVAIRAILVGSGTLCISTSTALAGSVSILSPSANSAVAGTVSISAESSENVPYHLELWDNGHKLGNVYASSLNTVAALAVGRHVITVQAVTPAGQVLDKSRVAYSVTTLPPTTTPPVVPVPPVPPTPPVAHGSILILSPAPGSTSTSAVTISARTNATSPGHLEISDNGYKLGEVTSSSVEGVYVLPSGSHVLTVQAFDESGSMVSTSNVNYTVAENCTNSRNVQCDLDQLPIDNTQNDCSPKIESMWVANGCGGGVQGVNPTNPLSTSIESVVEGGLLPNQGNLTLNGHSVHFVETQGTAHPSNVLFRGQSPATVPAGAIDSHWVLDEYVHLPDPTAHQAYEMDAQYTAGGIWTKFYTECAFNHNKGTGFWAVFDSNTGGWIYLNGVAQGGQVPPLVPCNRSQFMQPWVGSSIPSFSGWHHVSWSFLRNDDGTVTFESVTVDATTTQVNFTPKSATGGIVKDSGYFSALVQLDGVINRDGLHDVVDAYVSEISMTHNP